MKILLVQIGHYGDMVLATPMIRALRERFPTAAIDVMAAKRNAAIIRSHPDVRHVLVYEKRLQALWRLVRTLRRQQYDYWIDPKDHFSREGSLLARLGGAATTIGYNRPNTSVFAVSVPPAEENNAARLHVVVRNLQALAPLGITPPLRLKPEVFCTVDAERFVGEWREKNAPAQRLLVANISAGDASRYWTPEGWRTLFAALQGLCKAESWAIVINATPADAALAGVVSEGFPHVVRFPSRSIMDAVSLVKAAECVVTPDTAAIHIAAAFDVPVIALYNHLEWNFYKFAPLSSRATALRPDAEGEYLRAIQPERVVEAVNAVLVAVLRQ
jgi:ADP-heptose:LPS heptosyltransferase